MICTQFCTTALTTGLARAVPAAAAIGLLAIAMPAEASTQSNLRDCKAQLVLDGHVAETDRVRFDSASRSTVKLSIESESGTERLVTCKVKRGKVVGFEEKGTLLVARKTVEAAGN